MKLQEIHFKKPVKLIQLFKKVNIYGKSEKSFDLRKDQIKWTNPLSKSGHLHKDELFLPESVYDKKDIEQCEIILIADELSTQDMEKSKNCNQYFLPSPQWRFEIFELKKNLDIFLNYQEFEIGIPNRESFKLGSLGINQPIEIKINGKFDFSMTAGRERKFKEQQYILTYCGDFSKAFILREPFDPVKKILPDNRKVIDLNKPLW